MEGTGLFKKCDTFDGSGLTLRLNVYTGLPFLRLSDLSLVVWHPNYMTLLNPSRSISKFHSPIKLEDFLKYFVNRILELFF